MFWSEVPFFRTVKFKIALSYAALFLISFAVVFGIVFFHLAADDRYAADLRLNALFHEIEYEYLTGREPGPGKKTVRRLSRVPEKIYREIAKQRTGFIPLLAFRGTENRTEYTLIGKCGRELFQVEAVTEPLKVAVSRIECADRLQTIAAGLAGDASGAEGKPDYRLLLDRSGKLIARSPFYAGELPLFLNRSYRNDSERIQHETVNGSRHRIRLAYRRLFNGELLVLGTGMHAADETLERVAVIFFWTGLAVFLVSALAGCFLARRMFTGVDRVRRTAREIAAGDYSLRVAPGNEGLEVENLVSEFNLMVDNTEKLMAELRTISDNIAHDLRTPLTRMLACAEVTFSGDQTLSAYRDAMADNADECRRMLTLINTMLEISRTESGAVQLKLESFDAVELLRHSVELFRMVAEQKGTAISAALPPEPLPFSGDRMKIQQLFGNLIDNAVKFTPSGGRIAVALARSGNELKFSVSDTGCGIAEADRLNVFKRFYRADSSRNRPGNGLGLSLVQAIALAHGGRIVLESAPGKGSCFTVFLPLDHFGAFRPAEKKRNL